MGGQPRHSGECLSAYCQQRAENTLRRQDAELRDFETDLCRPAGQRCCGAKTGRRLEFASHVLRYIAESEIANEGLNDDGEEEANRGTST